MTREEAIYRLKTDVYKYADFSENPNEDEFWNAFDMAIIALQMKSISEKELEIAYIKGKTDGIKECTKELQKMIGR